jgi:signal transduction histidine kinase
VPESNSQATNPPQAAALTTRWLRPLGVTTIAVVLALSFGQHPAPALHGGGLAVTIALAVLVASFIALVRHSGGEQGVLVALVALIGASSALVYTQHGGLGVAGLFLAVAYAAMNLPLASSLGMLALAAATLALGAVHAERSAGLIVGAELGVVAFYVLATFARRTQEAHAQTASLLAELAESRRSQEEAAALRERSRIAREIHDVLAHSLSGLMLQLEGARMLAASPPSNGQLQSALERAHHLAHAGLEEARQAIGALRDEELPGAERLEHLAADFSTDSGVHATFEVLGAPRRLDSEASLTLFRVAQEALTNARKHAQPDRVELHLAYEPDGTRLVVEDHRDADARPPTVRASRDQRATGDERPGYGLTGMRERAELLRGELAALPTDDGFRVELWIPS